FVLYDADDRLVLHNSKFLEFTPGIADLIKPGIAFFDILRAVVDRKLADFENRRPDEWIAERMRQHADPTGFPEYEYNGKWLRISERRTPDGGTVSVFTDISELKRRQAELEVAREWADTANAAKSLFLANMSHELRTPLNAILGYTEMLQEDAMERRLEGQFGADLEKINGAGRHLLALINDILDLSKIEAGKMELFLESFDLTKMIDEVASTIRPMVEKTGNTLHIQRARDLGAMHADQIKVRQALFNLLTKAVKFTHEGNISLEVGRKTMDASEWILFRVTD